MGALEPFQAAERRIEELVREPKVEGWFDGDGDMSS